MAEPRAPLIEAFWSIQGEGRFVGQSMAFLRTATCPLRCSYCDTPHSYTAASEVEFALQGGPLRVRNPVDASAAADVVRRLRPQTFARTPRVSITGGEPLVFPDFVAAVGRRLRPEGWKVHLETAAVDAAALSRCAAEVDHLSADWKLPETIGGADHGDEHLACCREALLRGASVDVKIVLTKGVAPASLAAALDRLRPLREDVLLVLQPVTPHLRETEPLPPEALDAAVDAAGSRGFDVRVLPQVHKALRVP